jgi:hypothetical protein
MDSESKSQVKESSVFVPVENRFGNVLKPLVAFLCQDTVSSDILLWTQRCAAHRLSLVGNFCMDGAHPPTNYSDTVKEDTEEDPEEDTEDDIIPDLIRFFRLEIVELSLCRRIHFLCGVVLCSLWSVTIFLISDYTFTNISQS